MTIKSLLSSALVVASLAGTAQNKNVTYAITGDGNNDFVWMNIRQVDISTGQVTKTVFQRSETPYDFTDVSNGKFVKAVPELDNLGSRTYPTTSFVASAAFDKQSNRLYYTPMRLAELRWVDLNGKSDQVQFFGMQSDVLNVGNMNDEANHITRMTINADGNIYAITNDGNHLFRITTGKMPVITDLGNLVDDEEMTVSIHSKCTSWGGDMVADAFGKLYVITASHHIFVIDPATRIASHKGLITGLPAGYTTNAAAVSGDGQLIVASANMFGGYYTVNLDDMKASLMEGSDTKYNASDFANANLLLQKQADAANTLVSASNLPPITVAGETKVYPNPVINSNFNVIFDSKAKGNYTVILSDLAGRILQTNTVSVIKGLQTENIRIRARQTKGMFMVKVIDANNQNIMTEKIVVQ